MQYPSAAMEFVKFVLCVAVIVVAQAGAAPAGGKKSNAEFVLPELARKGFDMTVEATIDDTFKEDLKHKKSGVLRNGGENDGSYGIQLNGGSHSQRAPLRPARSEETNMYTLPRKLRYGDYVVVSGHHNNEETFTIDLLTGENYPDYNNIACQLEISEYGNSFTRRIIYEGNIDVDNVGRQTGSFLKNGTTFDIKFEFEEFNGELFIKIYINNSRFDEFKVEHDVESINFLKVSENIQITSLLFGYS